MNNIDGTVIPGLKHLGFLVPLFVKLEVSAPGNAGPGIRYKAGDGVVTGMSSDDYSLACAMLAGVPAAYPDMRMGGLGVNASVGELVSEFGEPSSESWEISDDEQGEALFDVLEYRFPVGNISATVSGGMVVGLSWSDGRAPEVGFDVETKHVDDTSTLRALSKNTLNDVEVHVNGTQLSLGQSSGSEILALFPDAMADIELDEPDVAAHSTAGTTLTWSHSPIWMDIVLYNLTDGPLTPRECVVLGISIRGQSEARSLGVDIPLVDIDGVSASSVRQELSPFGRFASLERFESEELDEQDREETPEGYEMYVFSTVENESRTNDRFLVSFTYLPDDELSDGVSAIIRYAL